MNGAIMDQTLTRALAAAARAFADEIERDLPSDDFYQGINSGPQVTAGSRESMIIVLDSVLVINIDEGRGASDEEMRAIAARAGMDPRGMAGYYTAAAKLLEVRDDGRWLTEVGRARLERLVATSGEASPT
jgi:hypothetical protein